MKTEFQLETSRDASMLKAWRAASEVARITDAVRHGVLKHEKMMPKLRELLGELNQRVHEANAYHNALNT